MEIFDENIHEYNLNTKYMKKKLPLIFLVLSGYKKIFVEKWVNPLPTSIISVYLIESRISTYILINAL